MQRLLLVLLFIINLVSDSNGQKHDNVWVFGYYYSPADPVPGLDFYWGAPDTVGFYPPFNFLSTGCVSMSDQGGNLQFYTDGDQVGNWNNQIIQNSSNYNSGGGNYYNQYWQGEISVPYPDHPGQYVIFHMYGSYVSNWVYPLNVYYSVIDMTANSGEGSMTQKQINVITDTLMPCSMQATRHANGRDWWVVVHKSNSNQFCEFLFTPDGVHHTATFASGPYLSVFNISEGQSVFSTDGSMYAIAFNTYNTVYLYDFDRCTGAISFRDSSHITLNDPNEWPVWGCSFSPNSRFLYATTNNDLYQFDTWSASFDASRKLVGTFDGFADPIQNYFFRHCPGPDGKIYITCWGGTKHLHVINDPDQQDTLCNFGQHQLELVSYHASTLPEFPNYRLGPVNGSTCDSLSTGIEESSSDAQSLNAISCGSNCMMLTYNAGPDMNPSFEMYDARGRQLFTITLKAGIGEYPLDVSALSTGIYVARMVTEGKVLTKKFVLNK